MPTPDPARTLPFASPADWGAWLSLHHATAPEVWIRIYKKASGIPSVDPEQAIVECLAWGWIDGVRHGFDDLSYLQRYTPRRKASRWSQKNCDTVARLIAEGRMQPPGLAQVQAARADGRWDAAYAGRAGMEIPADFLAALDAGPEAARAMFATLNRQNLYTIYHRLTTASRAETRAKRIADYVAMLARGETFY